MASFSIGRKLAAGFIVALVAPLFAHAAGGFMPEGGEYNIVGGTPGDQVYPHLSIKPTGGYLVWEDNSTDGDGFGISARKLDGSLSGTFSNFRVNANGSNDQERAQVSLLNNGGAIFTWQGGKPSSQHIYGRVLSSGGVWTTGDILVSTATNVFQKEAVVTTLTGGNAVVAWSSLNQVAGGMQDIYFQVLTPSGVKSGSETRANVVTAYNQRSVAIAPLSDGRYVIVWVSEQQRFENSTDVYARIFEANGAAATGEFLINSGTNVCSNPSVAPSADGGFMVAWAQATSQFPPTWDVYARPFSGMNGGTTRLVNTYTAGDQLAPKISSIGSDYLVAWTSMAQDGSFEGVYGQFLKSDGAFSGGEFRINTTSQSFQKYPAVASDGVATFLTVWSSYVGSPNSVDLFAQRYVSTDQPLNAPGAPIVTALSSSSLSVSWPAVLGFSIANYEVYADGAATATAVVTNTYWNATGLAAASTHSYRMAYVVADGRRSPLSGSTTNATYGSIMYSGIPVDWMAYHFGEEWPLASADSDGDGVSNKNEFLAGTDPNDANSVLKVRLQPTPQGMFLNWNTQVGLMYQVQQSTSVGGAWSNLGAPRFASGSVDSMYVGGGAVGYYRIVRLR